MLSQSKDFNPPVRGTNLCATSPIKRLWTNPTSELMYEQHQELVLKGETHHTYMLQLDFGSTKMES